MLRSLDSGVSGLQSQQTMLDVVSNNIANVNTAGYKANSVDFEDTLSQVLGNASGPGAGLGGTNPAQVGLGVRVAAIDTNFAEGADQSTGVGSNMMVNGAGFFIVDHGGQTAYTRAGDFTLDSAGDLVAPDGSTVQGWGATNGVVDTGAGLHGLHIPLGSMAGARPTTTVTMDGNLPADAAAGTTFTSQATTFDASGRQRDIALTYSFQGVGPTGSSSWSVTGSEDGGAASAPVTVTFDATGTLTGPAPALTIGGAAIDMTALTGYAGTNSLSVKSQNGSAAGTLSSFTISQDGTVEGSYSNGDKQAIGQIALAAFSNPSGLAKSGDSLFTATTNSGTPQVGAPGSGGGQGTITAGYVEGSNVDLAQEFTNLIVAQRAFQASANVITTSNAVLQELVNLKTN